MAVSSSFLRIALALAVAVGSTTAAARPAGPRTPPDAPGPDAGRRAAACDAALPLVWVDGGATPAAVLDEAAREATAIWARAGIALAWGRSGPERPIRPDDLLVMVRERLAVRPQADARIVRRRRTLGRVIRVSEDLPGRLIEVALPAIAAAIRTERLFDEPIASLPADGRRLALGRAIGRVTAHEIGHWLFGRGHAPAGLMRASIRRRDLVAARPPALPEGWPSRARAQLRVLRPCAPDAVRQPVTE